MKVIILGALGILGAGIASTPASAVPASMGFIELANQQGVTEQVAYKRKYRRHGSNWGGRHYGNNWGGKHYGNNWGGNHYRRHRHHHDNDNWGWGVPFGLGFALTAPYYGYGNGYGYGSGGYGSSHVEYCMRRYRSYDPSTNTFMGYDGMRHECRGPY